MRPFNWQAHLQPGEALLWQGRPYPALSLIAPRQGEWLIGVLGAVAVAALIIVDRTWAIPGSARMLFLIALIAALMVTGIPFRQMRMRSLAMKRRHYAVTDRRALVMGDARRPDSLTAWPIPARTEPVLEPGLGRLATLHFGAGSPRMTHLRDAEAVARVIRLTRDGE